MEVHRQTCQSCGSIEVRNILVREQGRATMVFVRCAKCKNLVARYRLQDYYHHGKGVDSFLRTRGIDASDSGRKFLEEFEKVQREAEDGLAKALDELEKDGRGE